MYQHFLFLHSWTRWLVVVSLAVLCVKFLYSYFLKKPYSIFDRVLSSVLLGSVHLQLILGLVLYFGLSSLVQVGLSNVKAAMANKVLRYWTIEHAFSMIVFVVLIQCGFSLSKRAVLDNKKHKLMLVFCGTAFLILMLSMPWPAREYGRVLFRY